ncbi:MAG: TetR/AcrR family transcriptional regulator [Bacteroidia bacterium]|nr:TetR/AcrR family transcriptional regulator [Bacteroidia bacterium]
MEHTRGAILEAARRLFNERGVAKTKTRDIAAMLNISQGNLTYHFPQRAALVEELYFLMIGELDQLMAELGGAGISLQVVYQWTLAQSEIQQRYMFIWLDFARIKIEHPRIEAHFAALIDLRKGSFSLLIDALQQAGILLGDISKEQSYWLFEQILVLGNFWPHAESVFQKDQSSTKHYTLLTLAPLLPYFSKTGLEAWQALSGNQP